jgi:Mg-chelatase subunit ChlD
MNQGAEELSFSTVERRLGCFIGALWGIYPPLRSMPLEDGEMPRRVSFGSGVVRVPERLCGLTLSTATKLFRAALAHVGAHFRYGGARFPIGRLKPLQVALISLIEDARVEQLAMRDFPGLNRLFLPFHVATPSHALTAPALLARLARALCDPGYADDNPWVTKGRAMFLAALPEWHDPAISRRIGGLLGNDLGQMRVQFNARTYVVEPPYRDDNQGLWDFGAAPADAPQSEILLDAARISQREGESSRETPEDATAETPHRVRSVVPDEDTGVAIATYPEWDYVIGRARADWTTLQVFTARHGLPRAIDEILATQAPLVSRLSTLLRAARVSRPERLRRQAEGEFLDLDACITASVNRRVGLAPDPRVYGRMVRRQRDLSTLLLLDASHSTNDPLRGAGISVLALERAAAALLGDAMAELGDAFAIRAFCSNGRHEVRYFLIKEFEAPFDEEAKCRLAGLSGHLSTRLGAALRHAGTELERQRTHRRLLLLVTDGEPSDIDVSERRYLVEDACHAVQELAHKGIDVFCVGLDAGGDAYFSRIFGRHNVVQIDRVEHLPEKLPLIYLRLTA